MLFLQLQLVLLLILKPSLAWKTTHFEAAKVESYEIQETVKKSGLACYNHCINTFLCQAVIYDQDCILITDTKVSNTGTNTALEIKNEIRGKVSKIEIKTSNAASSTTSNPVGVEICGETKSCCKIYPFDNSPTPFYTYGQLDTFTDLYLSECLNFGLHGLLSVKIFKTSTDGWLGEYLKIYLKHRGYYHCAITDWLDDSVGYSLELFLDCQYFE